MSRIKNVNVALCAIALILMIALTIVAAITLWRTPLRPMGSGAASQQMPAFASTLGSPSTNAEPVLQLQIQWGGVSHVDTTLTALASTLFINGDAAHPIFPGRASFLTGTVTAAGVCNTFSGLASPSWSRQWSITPLAWSTVPLSPSQQPLMGVARSLGPDGQYISTFLRLLAQNGYSAWSVMLRVRQVVVVPGTLALAAACVRWHWTPFEARPTDGLYAIRLTPSPAAPWSLAICDPGRYFSVLPGATDSSQTITLQTAQSNLSIFVNATMYTGQTADVHVRAVLQPDNSVCVLGLAALAWFSAACFDVGHARLGLLTTRIGNVVQQALPSVTLLPS